MTSTTTAPPPPTSLADPDAVSNQSSAASGVERRLAGWSAIGFATLVLAANAIAGSEPAMDATGAEVLAYLGDNRTSALIGTGVFALTAPMMIVFACSFYGRLRRVAAPGDVVFARIGAAGAIVMTTTFAATVAPRIALLAGVEELAAEPALARLLWTTEQAAFMLNIIPLSVALFGLGLAGARSGLLPRWFAKVAVIAAPLALLGPLFAANVVGGDEIGFAAAGIAFLSWMLLLFAAGIRQLRSDD